MGKPSSAKAEPVTYGKAYSGEVFKDNLKTYDMVQSLLNPMIKKSWFDYLIVLTLLGNIVGYYALSSTQWIIPVFVTSYFFWRLCYNLGIGILLYKQSNYNSLTKFARTHQLFKTAETKNSSKIQNFIEYNFKVKYGPKFSTTDYPVDFNTWLLFRNFVDLVLMQDFVNYFVLFVACFVRNQAYIQASELSLLFYSRWFFGILFIFINLIVKIDAHNVIKDFAWYWGDFFYLKINNEELIFDGIFELFPHPMYSIGYIGYYGFALLAKSYLVLFVSVIAHFTQFLFLKYVEDPHIDKTYNSDGPKLDKILALPSYDIKFKPLMFFSNFNFLRSSDYFTVLINLLAFLATFHISTYHLFLINLFVKLLTFGLNSASLFSQSKWKSITKIHLKYDLNFVDAFNNWCVYYNFQLLVNLNLLIGLFIKEFNPLNQTDDLFLFRLFIGSFLIFLNFICETSIVSSIGLYPWFYGDFWLPNLNNKQITKTGIYQYLNNPEKFLGFCGIWGLSVIAYDSNYIFILAMVWSLCKITFINFVETPHMIKLYGEIQVNYDSGFAKQFKKIIPKRLRTSSSSSVRPVITESPSIDSPITFHSPNPFISSSAGYALEFLNLDLQENGKLSVPVGKPIVFKYQAPKNHDKRDWIGLYKVINTFSSTKKTLISSNNHWIAIDPASYDNRNYGHENVEENLELYKAKLKENQVVLEFNNELLYWELGTYELRYHHTESHGVVLISKQFEITFDKIKFDDKKFNQEFFDLIANRYLKFQTPDGKIYQLKSVEDDYILLILNFINTYSLQVINTPFTQTHLNSYNIEEFKKKLLDKILSRLSYCIKNSIQDKYDCTNVTIEFSNEILIRDRTLKTLFERIARVKSILDEIAN